MKDFKNKYFEIVKIIELPCLNFSTYEAVRVLEDSISLRDAKLHHSALEKLAEIIKGADNRDYYFSELIKLAIESKSEPILKSTMITFGEKLDSYYISRIIKHTMELGDDNKLLELVWDKFANQIDDYHVKELILEFIEKNNIQFLEKFIAISANKLSSWYAYEIIKQAMELDNDEILTFILEKLSSNLDTYYANRLMEELIAAKNTELLNLVTDKLIDIIKSDDSGEYRLKDILEFCIKARDISLIEHILKFIDCDKFKYLQSAVTCAIEINEHQIFDILWDKFSEKIEEPSDIRILIKAAIKSENMGFFHIIWDKFANQIDDYYANELMEELIAAKNTKLLNLFTDKLTDIIKDDYYLKELFNEAIASNELQITKLIASALVGKVSASYVNMIIKYAIEINDNALLEEIISTYGDTLYSSDIKIIIKHVIAGDNKLLELVWDKFANQIDDYHAKQLMEELIAAKNTELLNLVTDKLTDIIKSGTIGDYYLKELFKKAIESNELQITKLIATALVGKVSTSYVNMIIKYAIEINDNALLEEIMSIYRENLDSSGIKIVIQYAVSTKDKNYIGNLLSTFQEKLSDDHLKDILEFCIKTRDISLVEHILKFIDCDKFQYSKNVITLAIEINEHQIFDILWDKFSEKILDFHKKSVIDVALKSENEFKIDTVVKKYIAGYYSDSESKFLIQNLLKSKQDVISKEIKILFSKLLVKLKTVDFESLKYFYQNDALYEKDDNGFPLAYYLSQKEVDIPARNLLDSLDINKYLPEGSSIFSRSSSYKYYVNKEASKSIMIVTGEDHNGAFNYDKINKYLNKGFNITTIDHRNEKDVCLKNYLFDYYSYLQEQSIDLYYSDLLILNMHGGIGGKSGKHTIERDGMGARTFEYLKDLTEKFEDKPVKVLLTACLGQAALLDSIEILPNGSEMLTISEYRKVGDKIKEINNDSGINTSYVANLSQRTDLSAGDVLKLENIAYLHIKGYSSNKPSPAYAKKDKDGNIKMFSCIEKVEDLIEEKIDLSYVKKLQQSFVLKYCGNEDIKCINKSSSVIEKTQDSIKYMHMLNLGYKYHAEEVSEKLLDKSTDDFNVNLALGCQIGFSEINGDFDV